MSTLFNYQKTFLFQAIQFSQIVLIQTIQLIISMQFSSVWPIDRTLSGATTLGQSGPGSDGNEGVLCIPQSSSITGTSPSDCLVSYPGHLLWGVLLICRGAVGVFYSPSQLGNWYPAETSLPKTTKPKVGFEGGLNSLVLISKTKYLSIVSSFIKIDLIS